MTRGYYFIVTGERYRRELLVSLKQLRQQTQLPICIASDLRMDVECDQFIWIAEPKFSSQDKMISLPMSPFSETIYIDSDMSFFSSPDPIFDGLQGADLLVSHEASLGLGPASVKAMITPVFPEVSTGLMAFRKTATAERIVQKLAGRVRGTQCQAWYHPESARPFAALFFSHRSDSRFFRRSIITSPQTSRVSWVRGLCAFTTMTLPSPAVSGLRSIAGQRVITPPMWMALACSGIRTRCASMKRFPLCPPLPPAVRLPRAEGALHLAQGSAPVGISLTIGFCAFLDICNCSCL